jgi:hypothetical protein
MKPARLLLLLPLLATALPADPDTPFPERVWTNNEGRKTTAKLVSAEGEKVTIRIPEGREFTLERTTLSLEDIQYIDDQKQAVTDVWPDEFDPITADLASQGFRFGFPVDLRIMTSKVTEIRPSSDFSTVTLVLESGIICPDIHASRLIRDGKLKYQEKTLYQANLKDFFGKPADNKRLFAIGDTIRLETKDGFTLQWLQSGVLKGISVSSPSLEIKWD